MLSQEYAAIPRPLSVAFIVNTISRFVGFVVLAVISLIVGASLSMFDIVMLLLAIFPALSFTYAV